MSKKLFTVTLTLFLEESDGDPEAWLWDEMLDLPWADVIIENVEEVRD